MEDESNWNMVMKIWQEGFKFLCGFVIGLVVSGLILCIIQVHDLKVERDELRDKVEELEFRYEGK